MKKMTMTATGDCILIQGFPEAGYEGLEEIREFIGKGQAKIGNLEMSVTDYDTYASAYCGGTWLNSEPRILKQAASFGYNFFGYANNHTMDLGPDGMAETIENVKKTGVSLAGAGKDLYEASRPVYRTFAGGRVAFISIASSFNNSAALAGYASKTMKGRPGVNGLRVKSYLMLNREHFDQLTNIRDTLHLTGSLKLSRATGFTPSAADGVENFTKGVEYRLAEDGKEQVFTQCNVSDLQRVRQAIEDAKFIADYIVVSMHCHDMKGADRTSELPDFLTEFAHFCVDNGAHAVIGTGVHQLRSIEIYKGKPIFYSLGDFCFQTNVVERQPADFIDKYHMSPDITDVQALAARNKGWTIGLHTQPFNFQTVIPYLEYEDDKLVKALLKPVDLGFEKSRTFKGIPYPADEKNTKEIFDTLCTLSERFGTKLQMTKDGLIEIKL